ncbi:MAG: Homoserine dehydrogenase [Parcubacteria group bacterium GW2011_GWC1_35_8]|uniref:homoserine dehydrogenase n=2 Tax=Candidatus Nomuraibacteriota TaxID=1752729 RepID=A0A1F6YW14_9BACT|nr:MAG: Homoserine dehydrogenase [Parcubacteria group bacterium GW2011_GWC1_35_8]KKP88702.1 MAG: Homoserine dehydrogenase [Candidatus Nomurabacteria bacterium GW2011_GWC2_35_8]OGJ05901.1 MAG: hypothetical protein A2238_00660 [Candidatus Nomurabacteria bacterium RIFOXYA2_FULL_35_9]OGJ10599.1 MAG: hypothetical protein A2456_02580 [Candidatus Nomurabacteria bacterium RIFOXYC2_FULL_36_19]OGJ14099.1 MAG: hypothetical protein A2554_01105 [Candidatus Nomurabacteria bacterium RIFOXYD2_FULL_35_12]
MKKIKKVAIIGVGAIARRLLERLEIQGCKVCFQFRRNQTGPSFEQLLTQHMPEAVFVAISTLDKGEAARNYILKCVEVGIPVITCEKGAIAYHAKELKPYFNKIGFSATVGGGTKILNYTKDRNPNSKFVQIHVVLNGTLNFIFDEMRHGRTLGEACAEAGKLGYAEPGANDSLSLINGELSDIARKTCVFFNTVLSKKKFLTPKALGSFSQTSLRLKNLCDKGEDYRLVVSFSNSALTVGIKFLGKGFKTKIEGWNIFGGFRKVNGFSDFMSWLPGGVGNAIHIIEGKLGAGGKYTLSGPGAGIEPTTSAMIDDYNRLCP